MSSCQTPIRLATFGKLEGQSIVYTFIRNVSALPIKANSIDHK